MDYLLNDSTDAWFNMAFDEYCLERYPCDGAFFYLWRNSPSVIIGYNQNVWAEVDLDYIGSRGIRLARRVTGGGAVYHDLQNLNYTIVGRGVSPQPVVDALRSLGLDAVLSGRNDIFVGGRKVSGFARRLGSRREIIHGTLMYDVDLDEMSRALDAPGSKLHAKGVASVRSRVANIRDLLPGIASVGELASALTGILGRGGRELGFGEERLDAVRRLSETKFSTWDSFRDQVLDMGLDLRQERGGRAARQDTSCVRDGGGSTRHGRRVYQAAVVRRGFHRKTPLGSDRVASERSPL